VHLSACMCELQYLQVRVSVSCSHHHSTNFHLGGKGGGPTPGLSLSLRLSPNPNPKPNASLPNVLLALIGFCAPRANTHAEPRYRVSCRYFIGHGFDFSSRNRLDCLMFNYSTPFACELVSRAKEL